MQLHFPEVIQINDAFGSDNIYVGLYGSEDTGSRDAETAY